MLKNDLDNSAPEIGAQGSEKSRWRSFQGPMKIFVVTYGVIMVLFHIYAVVIEPIDPWILRSSHLGFATTLAFLLLPASKNSPADRVSLYDWLLIFGSVSIVIYVVVELEALVTRTGFEPTPGDIVFGLLQIFILIEAARRLTGIVLPIFAISFFLYAMFGSSLPGILGFPAFKHSHMISLIFSEQGIYGVPVYASATLALFFITFGSFLRVSGAGSYLIKIATALAGGRRGGPAKIAIFASAFFGMISGSAASNVATTGTFTIPLMKKTGYRSHFAGAVEATASAGGQVMPPLMGTGAFIMAELIGMPFSDIMLAAFIPAFLYYAAVFMMIDFEAKKIGLVGLPRRQLPPVLATIKEGTHLFVPLFVLIYLMVVMHMSPVYSILWSLLALILMSWFRRIDKITLSKIIEALYKGARGTLMIAVACGVAGIIVGVLTATGLGIRFATIVLQAVGGNLYLVLFFTMILAILLGMDMPTAPAYIIASAVAAPALVRMGIPVFAAHLFCFYFAVFSTLTPPVALSAFTASAIAEAPIIPTALTAIKLASGAFIVPFAFALGPALLLMGDTIHVILAVGTSLIGILSLALALQYPGLFRIQRILFLFAAFGMIFPGYVSDVFGIGGLSVGFAIQGSRKIWHKKTARTPIP